MGLAMYLSVTLIDRTVRSAEMPMENAISAWRCSPNAAIVLVQNASLTTKMIHAATSRLSVTAPIFGRGSFIMCTLQD